jgi:DNA excision repair protein ERCC-3
LAEFPDLVYLTLPSQLELLSTVLISNQIFDADEDESRVDDEDDEPLVIKRSGNINSLSGADTMAYLEFSRTTNSLKFQ